MPIEKKNRELITEEEYWQSELTSEIKHEYVDGQVYAMAGASKAHDTISGNIFSEFHSHLKKSPCRPFGSDVKLKTSSKKYRYTDGMVVCDDSGDEHYTQTPVIIVEVLSKSTRHRDKGEKLLEYINIPSLKEYVMIEQDFVTIDVLRRSEGWVLRNYSLGNDVHFESIDLTLSVEEIYHRVENEDMLEFLKNQ